MKFERRDIGLIIGIFLVVLGITQYVPFEYSAIIGVLLYFAIKMYVEWRKKSIRETIPEGICMECGSKITNKKCPNCAF